MSPEKTPVALNCADAKKPIMEYGVNNLLVGGSFADHVSGPGEENGRAALSPTPHWDAETRELRMNGHLVKRFKWKAANQETVLAAFEEEGWCRRIDDPLPPQPGQLPARRLSEAIKRLNGKQKNELIRFRGDGTGEGVTRELIERDDADG